MNIKDRLKSLRKTVESVVWPKVFQEKFGKPGEDFRTGDEAYYMLRTLGIGTDLIIAKMIESPALFIPRQNIIMAFFCGISREWIKREGAEDMPVIHPCVVPAPGEMVLAMDALWPTVESGLQAIMDKYPVGVPMSFWQTRFDPNRPEEERRANEERANDARRATDLMHCAVSIITGAAEPSSLEDLRGWLEAGFQTIPLHLVNRFPKQEGGQLVSNGRPVERQGSPYNGRQLRVENGNGHKEKSKPRPAVVEKTPAAPLRDIASQLGSVTTAPAVESSETQDGQESVM